jgi:hypothetical protein
MHYLTGNLPIFWFGWLASVSSVLPVYRVEPSRGIVLRVAILGIVALLHVTTYFTSWDAALGLLVSAGILGHLLALLYPLTNPFKRMAFIPVLLIFGGTIRVGFSDPSTQVIDFPTYPFWVWHGILLGVSYMFLAIMLIGLNSVSLPRGVRKEDQIRESKL